MSAGRKAPLVASTLAGLALAALAALASVDLAGACSCAQLDPRDELAKGRPALIGRVLERRPEGNRPFPQDHVYTVEVERALNFAPGKTVEVTAGSNDAACGVVWKVDDRVGAFLHRDGEVWTAGLCGLVEPDDLLRALEPYPKPNGAGRLALLAGGKFANARVMALDKRGRILGYGPGAGTVTQISVCPRSRLAAELVDRGRRGAIVALRSLRTLELLRETRVPRATTALLCTDRRAGGLFTAATRYPRRQPLGVTRITRLQGGQMVPIASVSGATVALSRAAAYVANSRNVRSIDLRSGAKRRLLAADHASGLAPSPDGRLLAIDTRSGLRLLDLRTGRVRSAVDGGGTMTWLGALRLLTSDRGVRVYNRRLEHRRLSRFYFGGGAHLGHQLIGVDGYDLVSLDLRHGRRRLFAELPDPDTYHLVATPGARRLRLPVQVPAEAALSGACPLSL